MSIQNPSTKIRIEGEEGGERQIDAVDRLSSLPDHVLHHVLSFLDETQFSVRTSVLSRRWRYLWKYVPHLTFNTKSFAPSSFARYVDEVLSRRPEGCSVDEICYFHLNFSLDKELFHRVVKFAASRSCQELVVSLPDDYEALHSYMFAPFATSNLRILRFRRATLESGFGSCGLRMLTTLDLDECLLPCDTSADLDPFANLPCLENLILCSCALEDALCGFKISRPRLVKLLIFELCCSKLEIFAPKLKFLDYMDGSQSPIMLQLDLPSLDHARISVQDNGRVEKNKEKMKASCISLLQGLHNASSLSLHPDFFELLNSNCEFLEHRSSPFTRLKSLQVWPYFPDFQYIISHNVISYFMKGSSRHGPETIEFV